MFGKILNLLDFVVNPIKDIEVFGMFGPGNLGDEAMLVAAQDNLPRERCIPWQNYPNRPAINSIIRKRSRKHLLVGGGTLIHGGETGWLDYIELRSQQGSQVSFLGTGVAFTENEVNHSSESYQRWCKVLARSQEIHLRGSHSVELCQRMGSHADVFGDFAFLLYREDVPVRDSRARSDVIGINVGNCLGDQESFLNTIALLVKWLSKYYRLVFHVVVASDMEATQEVISRAGLCSESWEIEEHYFNPYEFMRAVRSYRAFIGLKLHATGLAMVAGVPTLMIAYLPKCVDFMTALSADQKNMLFLPLDIEMVILRVEKILNDPQDYLFEIEIASIAANQRRILGRIFN